MKQLIFSKEIADTNDVITATAMIFEGLTHYFDKSGKLSYICATFSAITNEGFAVSINIPYSVNSDNELINLQDEFIDQDIKLVNTLEPIVIVTPIVKVYKEDAFYVEGFTNMQMSKDPEDLQKKDIIVYISYAQVCLISAISNEICSYHMLPEEQMLSPIYAISSTTPVINILYDARYKNCLYLDKVYKVNKHTLVMLVTVDLKAYPEMTDIKDKKFIKYFIVYDIESIKKSTKNVDKLHKDLSWHSDDNLQDKLKEVRSNPENEVIIDAAISISYSMSNKDISNVNNRETAIVNAGNGSYINLIKFKGLMDSYTTFKINCEELLYKK